MTTYILGGAGFIGTQIATFMSSRQPLPTVVDIPHRLQRCSRLLTGCEQISVHEISAETVTPLIEPGDRIICLHWSSQPASSMIHLVDDARLNIIGTIELMTSAINAGAKRIIFASSGGTVYGNTERMPIREDFSLAPVSAYGAAKVAVEVYLNMLAATYDVTGISLRVGNPYGRYQLLGTPIGVIANFIRCLRERRPVTIYGDGSKVRDYISVSDVASAFAAATTEVIPSGAYNIGSGSGVSVSKIVEMLERMTSTKFAVMRTEDRSFDARSVILDNSKFRKATSWVPRIGLEDGIRAMLEYYDLD